LSQLESLPVKAQPDLFILA